MHLLIATLLAALGLSAAAQAQPRNQTPTLLMGPSDWRFESMPIPPLFATDVKLKGVEEARFSPGMFDTSSSNYFTYVIVLALDEAPDLGAADLKDFLDKYYRGLSIGVGRRKTMTPDPRQFNAVVNPATPGSKTRFEAKIPYFDTFNDGRRIMLTLELAVTQKPAAKKTFVVVLISPQPKEAAQWTKLREIGSKLTFDGK